MSGFYLGIDFGTSGARAIAIDANRQIHAQTSLQFAPKTSHHWATTWQTTLFTLIEQIPRPLRHSINAIAINGTSSTVLLCNAQGQPLTEPILYNDARGETVLDNVRTIAPANHTVINVTSSFAKLLWWESYYKPQSYSERVYFLHQADWLAFLLHGQLGVSDYHNALKLGYDVEQQCYPDWITNRSTPFQLPHVVAPGTPVGTIQPQVGDRLGIPASCAIGAGTTDSIAAFLASGANTPGEAVTSLGSTLVLKLLSQSRVDDARYGIYSHRLGNLWLVGGASNTGGAVLRHYFSPDELNHLSQQIPTDQASPLNYYPLLQPGERFPINDPTLSPRLEPRPTEAIAFLHGLLESIARIEASGYQRLQQFGATPLQRVYTAGGGAANLAWSAIRQRHLQVPVGRSLHTEAAYGTALLALQAVGAQDH
ncbi:FGGY-family carbohydrate kinase [Oculatella sp. LEGE 06141]|uniref:FGGY-family carbohydrate kinase n=1 Tax=Oculatella sp. LEGE 06141 TaxID=1828648 RepID=UPI00187F0940|nr:FGGY-family carbohydrate kinase [Oculatella sp. LEGE 06141]MBE9180791.1 FGGY-family carbohydrate kinase [Oculatella sp. LEGE 06141]